MGALPKLDIFGVKSTSIHRFVQGLGHTQFKLIYSPSVKGDIHSGILKSGVNWESSWSPELKTKRYVCDEYYSPVPVAQTMMKWHMCDMHIQPSIFTVRRSLRLH